MQSWNLGGREVRQPGNLHLIGPPEHVFRSVR